MRAALAATLFFARLLKEFNMKKKFVSIILAAACLSTCALALSACDLFKKHEHNFKVSEIVEPDCFTEGFTVYKCDCGQTKHDDYKAKLQHNYVDYVCTLCESISGDVPSADDLEFTDNGFDYTVSGLKAGSAPTELIIPSYHNGKEVKSVAQNAFENCTSLQKLTIGYGVFYIKDKAFKGCTDLSVINLAKETDLYKEAFAGCTSLTSVTLPKGCGFSDSGAFADCTSLISAILPEDIGGRLAAEQYRNSFAGCSALTTIFISGNNEYYCSVDGVLYSKDKKTLIEFPAGKATTYSVLDGTTLIGDAAFANCDKLTEVRIPLSVTEIGYNPFRYCSQLKQITYDGTIAQWKQIQKGNNWDFATGEYTVKCSDGTINKSEEKPE